MPWKETCAVDERLAFVLEWLAIDLEDRGMTELWLKYGISRKSGYKWINRFDWATDSIMDVSSRPHTCPHATPPRMVEQLLETKKEHPRWGPRAVRDHILNKGRKKVPAVSTISGIFKSRGLVRPRRRRATIVAHEAPLAHCQAPNDVWCTDFKGHFARDEGVRCYP